METLTCKGCGNNFTGKYCNQCGQKVIERFNLKYLFGLLHADLLEVDRGWWRTAKDLTLRPGETIEAYLGGNTKKYFSPVKYLFIIATIVYLILIVDSVFSPPAENSPFDFSTWQAKVLSNEVAPFSAASFQELMNIFPYVMNGNMATYFLILLPFAAFAGRFFFRQFNFTELLIVWIYLWAHILYLLFGLSFAITPILLLGEGGLTGLIIIMAAFFFVMFYFFTKTFRHLTKSTWIKTFFKVLLTMYGGFFAFFGLAWVALGMFKMLS